MRLSAGLVLLALLLGASGIPVTPGKLVPLVYVPEREGSFQVEMVAATRSFGRLAYRITPTLNSGIDENHTMPLAAFERNHAPAHNNLAQVMLELGQREQALIHAHIAVELGGDYLETFRATLLSIEATN